MFRLMIEPNEMTEDRFGIKIYVLKYTFSSNNDTSQRRSYIRWFSDVTTVPCQLLPSLFPPYLHQLLSQHLPSDNIQTLSSYVISYAHSILNDPNTNPLQVFDNDQYRLLPFTLVIAVPTTIITTVFEGGDGEDLDRIITNRVMGESMQDGKMIPASEEAIASLKKVEVLGNKLVETCHRCNVCLKDFEDDDDVSRMPCDHVFHTYCIVRLRSIPQSRPKRESRCRAARPTCSVVHGVFRRDGNGAALSGSKCSVLVWR
ncbi:E3 ubiquitin-protein ligase RING1-like [Senna tora]|uniref:E3 ubiquitin-protein ligase RING1-like n=1 Tax=Senna tora TaxID=362788 RepID=A0A834T0M6_9FABA|nr:E3 ubiquitin-protein ligase RING1-like [Senna tora]